MTENQIDEALKPRPDQATINRQKMAADPLMSAWVSANAGSGKTYVLSTRVIRLLLDGVDPSKILCLTYTKTAAAEMKNRVFSRLAEWVTMEEAALAKSLSEITGKSIREPELSFARTLFARALETPGGLKIQTIHAFCEALLHRFPLEANIAGHFELIDEKASEFLVAEARRILLTGKNETTRTALARTLARAGETGLEKLLNEIVAKREKLNAIIDKLGDEADRKQAYLNAYGFTSGDTSASIEATIFDQLPIDLEFMRSVRDEAASLGKSRAYEFAYGCVVALENQNAEEAFAQLKTTLVKESGEAYSPTWLFAKDILNKFPTLAERYAQAASVMSEIVARTNLLDEISKTLDALSIADRLLSLYSSMKNRRGLLDFEDLINRTESMLLKDNVAAWVRYKLDQGIDHILVDEAQDTSPAQWRVIRILADEFFDGESAASNKRTVFAVGDEKQSIYSFQGADPRGFDDARLHFKIKVGDAQRAFEDLRLDASFRSTGDVLSAVDHVFSHIDSRRGLSGAEGNFPPHQSLREKQPGNVQLWDLEEAQETEDEEDWRKPVDHAKKPAVIVAERVAEQIKQWIDDGACLEASGKPIQAGDVLVLVRKRDAFVNALSRALKNRDVPVAGADRLSMVSHIAVMDLMALGRIILNSSDDLSLAALLRSPLFGWSDQQLFDLAYDRQSASLYEQLALLAPQHEHSAAAYIQLERWKTIALHEPVFEFYSHVLGVGEGRKKLISRLGPETGEMLDEFLSFAIAQERTGAVALETFLNTLENFSPEIKREMDGAHQQVKIMTVHGAKGLEAPIVFLVDPGSAAFTVQNAPALLPISWKDGSREIEAVLWGNSGKQRSVQAGDVIEELRENAEQEYRRLLYVGMTRA
ncbi:MAG: double-strand break repair helicase AddA, partial [Pseudomonadota bacterium]